jgi:hypothetical protein
MALPAIEAHLIPFQNDLTTTCSDTQSCHKARLHV